MSEKLLHILLVRPIMGHGGADRVTLNILAGFDRTKYKIDLALMQRRGAFINDIPGDITVFDLNARTPLFMVPALRKLIRKQSYDVCYSTSGGTNVPLILATGFLTKKPTVVISERTALFAPGKNALKQQFHYILKYLCYGRADFVATVSKALKEQLAGKLKLTEAQLKVVDNPIVNDSIGQLQTERLPEDVPDGERPMVLAVGRLIPLKDHELLLRAFALVLESVPEARLYILGTGPLENRLRILADELGIDQDVKFIGFDKNPFRYMARCSLFVSSSRHEGMPGVIVQALACGAPVVSTDCPTGPSELIEHGENGYLVPVGDTSALADKMIHVLTDTAIAIKFKESGPKSVLRFHERPAISSYFSFLDDKT